MTNWETFRDNIKKVKGPRHHKISGSWGVYQAHRYTMKNKWFNIGKPVSDKEYYKIIRTVNKALVQDFLNGEIIIFPYSLGSLVPVKKENKSFFYNNKLRITSHIDWNATIKLWSEDEEAYNNKLLVRKTNKEKAFITFFKNNKVGLTNRNVLFFQPNRTFKELIIERAKEEDFFAYKY